MPVTLLLIPGQKLPVSPDLEASPPGLQFEATYKLSSDVRGATVPHEVQLTDDHVLELTFDDNTTWVCGKDSLEDIFPGTTAVPGRSGAAGFVLPAYLQPPAADRGWASGIAIKLVSVFTKKAIDTKVADIAKAIEDKQLAGSPGLYRVDAGFQLQPFNGGGSEKPYLLFLHGTASSTEGSFAGMLGTPLWDYLLQQYAGRIIACQHRSLTESPLTNVCSLLRQLPSGAELHLISHSRGGLLGEILCRYSGDGTATIGFTDKEKQLLQKSGRTQDVSDIGEIEALLASKKIFVKKFIRVACPASGTTLASKRLDGIFNVLLNLIGLGVGGVAKPVYDLFKALIAAVINTKNDPAVLPGIEAMNPESPFIKALNDPALPSNLTVPLVVISGNCKAKLNLKALIIIASKLFYLKDNDLVVNTGAMYQGSRRQQSLSYFFDHNTDVDHFSYFSNERTRQLILAALRYDGDGLIPGFSMMTDAEAAAYRNALLNLDGGRLMLDKISGTKPIAVIMPGIMGSNLDVENESVWINYARFLTGGLRKLAEVPGHVSASSVVATSYKKLADYLSDRYDVITFPFDWRLNPAEYTALFDTRVKELLAYGQPIKIIGHSMGGVLIRDFMVNHPDTWNQLNSSAGFGLLFLGSPLGGSHRILNVLLGFDPIISKLSKIDLWHTKKDLIDIFSKMPGILSLLPLTEDALNDFADHKIWDTLLKLLGWEVCDESRQQLFKNFGDYRQGIKDSVGISFENAVYIAGQDDATPCGYRIDQKQDGPELTLLSTAEGDQSVTWELGIPKELIAAGRVYYVPVSHGMLANEPKIFNGIAEILATGKTGLLKKDRPTVRGAEKVFKAPDLNDFDLSPAGISKTLLGLDTVMFDAPPVRSPLRVFISQGDLQYASYPVVAGHFNGDGILMAEKSIDRLLSHALSQKHTLGLYPGPIGSSEVVLAHAAADDDVLFKGALIVGLGDAGKLTAYQLTLTVEQGVANYLVSRAGNMPSPSAGEDRPLLGLSSLIIGGSYGGLTIENSMRAIVQGVQNGNRKICKLLGENAPAIGRLEFIEKYEDRALSAYYALDKLTAENSSALNIIQDFKNIRTLFGLEKRVPMDQIEEWWNRINVKLVDVESEGGRLKSLQFSASTGGAREELRMVYSSVNLLDGMIKEISADNAWSPESAKIIFELLIPNDFKEQFKKHLNINWILDKETAAYPWELLHDGRADTMPLAINAGMIRQLATEDYRLTINAVSSKTALVIAEPDLQGTLPALPGAKLEGDLVYSLLDREGFAVTPPGEHKAAIQILKALFSRDYKIIHLAGHGVFDPLSPETSGMAIGPNLFLSTREIAQMSAVPELVFINCCYLGQVSGAHEQYYQDRYKLAANIGTQLIENGVKAVVAAGWEVNDAAALVFTQSFYTNMFSGNNFGESVRLARAQIYNDFPGSNTWGAYQCYGDPFYKIDNDEAYVQERQAYDFKIDNQAEIELFNLLNELEMPGTSVAEYLDRLSAITDAVNVAGLRNAKITQLEAFIYAELGGYEASVRKFEELFGAEQAEFSFKAAERYCNIRGKLYVQQFLEDRSKAAVLAQQMQVVIDDLKHLLSLGETAERHNLLAGAYKRKAILSTGAERNAALAAAADQYRRSGQLRPGFYPYTGWMQMEGVMVRTGSRNWNQDVMINNQKKPAYHLPALQDVEAALAQLLAKVNTEPHVLDYWDWVARANVMLCTLVIHPAKDNDSSYRSSIAGIFQKLWARAGSPYKKKAEEEQLRFLSEMLAAYGGFEISDLLPGE